MLRLHYAGGSLITSDDVASAVMEYARVLAVNETSDLVKIPIADDEGNPAESELLIGPASQLHTTPLTDDVAEIDGLEVIADLTERTLKLERGPVATWSKKTEASAGDTPWDYGDDSLG